MQAKAKGVEVMISSLYATEVNQNNEVKRNEKAVEKKGIYGRVIGEPKLSEKAAKYYEKLKNKFQDKDFILVSKDMKDAAKAQAGKFANPNRMVVLIDEEKIERMAEDEEYRKQYEMIISSAGNKMAEIKEGLDKSGISVTAFGMQIDEGGASLFAVVNKSMVIQRERIAQRAQEKKAEKKLQEKKAARKKEQERLEEKKELKRAEEKEKLKEEQIVVRANSVEELLTKLQDLQFEWKSNNILTEAESKIGQNFDFNI